MEPWHKILGPKRNEVTVVSAMELNRGFRLKTHFSGSILVSNRGIFLFENDEIYGSFRTEPGLVMGRF